jgi:hypothetical protein
VLLREGVPAYVTTAAAGVREGKYKWKDIQKPFHLAGDALALANA